MFSVYGIGRTVADPTTGLLAAFFLGTAPFVVYSLLNFQLDLPSWRWSPWLSTR